MIGWGTFSPYISSYFHSLSSSTTPSNLLLSSIFIFLSETVSFIFISYLSLFITPIYFIIFGILLCCPAIFISSYITDPDLFSCVFGTSIGILGTCCFMPSVWIAWSVIPQNKATSAGIALAAYSTSPIFYGIFFTLLTNPNEVQAIPDYNTEINYFPKDVTDRVPYTLRFFSVALALCGALGCFCLKSNRLQVNTAKNSSTISTWEMLKNWKMWYVFIMSFCLFFYTFYLINTYKDIAMVHIKDDYFLAAVGALSFVIGSGGRFFYGRALDLYSWKWVIGSALVLQIACAALMEFSFGNKYFFAAVFFVGSFAGTAMFLGSMMITDKAFPHDRWIFSYVNFALVFDVGICYLIRNFFTPAAGELWTNFLMIAVSTIGLFQVIYQFDTEEYQKLI